MNEIGEKIREARKKKGLSQEALAEAASINLRTIQRIENNESEPRGKTLTLICEVLEITAEDILNYGKQPDRNYLIMFHLSVIAFLFIPIGNIILPLILWLTKKDRIVGLKEAGPNLLNYQIVWSVLLFASSVSFAVFTIMHYKNAEFFAYIFIGLLISNIVLPVIFAIRAKNGNSGNRYPNLIKLIR